MTVKDEPVEMSAQEEFESYIPRPIKGKENRRMVAIDVEAYDSITALAQKNDTTRGKVISAVVKFFINSEE